MAITGVRLRGDTIFSSCGLRKGGEIVTIAEAGDSWQWIIDSRAGEFIDDADIAADTESIPSVISESPEVADEVTTDVSDDVETETETETETGAESNSESEFETPVVVPADVPADGTEVPETEVPTETDVVAKLKESIGDKKYRIDDIVERTGLTEDVVVAALTEANGFQKNQQGWWKVVKS